MTEGTGDELVTLMTASSPFEGQTVAAVLRDAGIEVVVFDAVQQGAGLPLGGRLQGVPIHVFRRDVQRARAVLAGNAEKAGGIDWANVDVGEREDDLPLRPPGRMPPAARLAFLVTAAILALGLLAVVIALF